LIAPAVFAPPAGMMAMLPLLFGRRGESKIILFCYLQQNSNGTYN
jgi:hypothetical protein